MRERPAGRWLGGFLISYYDDRQRRLDSVLLRLRHTIRPFGRRLWRHLHPDQELPSDLRVFLVVGRVRGEPWYDRLPQERPDVAPAWEMAPVDDPTLLAVEVWLRRGEQEVWHAFLPMDAVFRSFALAAADAWTAHGDLTLTPGPYRYDVRGILEEDLDALDDHPLVLPETPGSFLLDAPADEAIRFMQVTPSVGQAGPASTRFVVTAAHEPGPTRLTEEAWGEISQHLELPLDREVGGHLVGTISGEANREAVVTIRRVVPAVASAGDAARFLMSPESSSSIARHIARRWPEESVVGWYHTHTFASEDGALDGLSSIDHAWHDKSFTQPWSIALLVNVWRRNDTISRRVRVYRRDPSGRLVESTYRVVVEETP